jgi:hypothetical protein
MKAATRFLAELSHYYLRSRQTGHTQAMIETAKRLPDAVIIVATARCRERMRRELPNHTILLPHPMPLLGREEGPILIDNFALASLAQQVVAEVVELEGEIEELKELLTKTT